MIGDGTTAVDSTSAAELTSTAGVCHGSVVSSAVGADRSVRAPIVRSPQRRNQSRSGVRVGWSATGVRSPSRLLSDARSVRSSGPAAYRWRTDRNTGQC